MRQLMLIFLICCGYLQGYDPIDVVYTWTNTSDPEWVAKRKLHVLQSGRYAELFAGKGVLNEEKLKYSLRSIYAYAPFVRSIFIVTDGQRPKWLKDHPQIKIISHQDIFGWQEHLPVFQSGSVEANIHRIPGLSERYVCCNDAMFLGKTVFPGDFFTSDGKIMVFESPQYIPGLLMPDHDLRTRRAWNTCHELEQVYGNGIKPRFLYRAPYAQRKSLVRDTERVFPELFEKSSAERFRSRKGYEITGCLIQYVGLYTGRAKASRAAFYEFPFTSVLETDSLHMRNIIKKKPKFFSLKQRVRTPSEEGELALSRFLDEIFPSQAPWEK